MKIGISGKIASGKSTVAAHITRKYGGEIHPFAEPMKALENIHANFPNGDEQTKRIWPIINDIAIATGKPNEATHLLTMVEKVFAKHEPMPGRKNRAFLQEIGTECVRKQFDDLAWVKYLIYKYGNDDTIVDDVRFENEAKALSDAGFMLIRLEIDPEEQRRRIIELYGKFDPQALKHLSEVDLDNKKHLFHAIVRSSVRPVERVLERIDKVVEEYSNVK